LRKIELSTIYFNKITKEKKVTESSEKIENTNRGYKLYDIMSSITTGVFFVAVIFVFLVRGVGVEGISMQPTLDNGDYVIVSSMFYEVERGDIVVISPYKDLKKPIIKRVIGVEGDVVDIDFKAHKVYVNSVELDEPYIGALTARRYDVKFPVTVPEGCYFVLGDNRNDSLDSRSSQVGFVESETVFGKVILKMVSLGSTKNGG